MNKEKTVSEQELDKVAGGTGGNDNGFEAAWAEYTRTHCDRCAQDRGHKEYEHSGPTNMVCDGGKLSAAAEWPATGSVRCPAFIDPC